MGPYLSPAEVFNIDLLWVRGEFSLICTLIKLKGLQNKNSVVGELVGRMGLIEIRKR